MTEPKPKAKYQYLLPEDEPAYESWLTGKNDRVRMAANAHPPFNCYREPMRPHAHYLLTGYKEPHDASKPMLGIVTHGADSFLPGVEVGGVALDELQLCGCGAWIPSTPEQNAAMAEHFAALDKARALAPKPEPKH